MSGFPICGTLSADTQERMMQNKELIGNHNWVSSIKIMLMINDFRVKWADKIRYRFNENAFLFVFFAVDGEDDIALVCLKLSEKSYTT